MPYFLVRGDNYHGIITKPVRCPTSYFHNILWVHNPYRSLHSSDEHNLQDSDLLCPHWIVVLCEVAVKLFVLLYIIRIKLQVLL